MGAAFFFHYYLLNTLVENLLYKKGVLKGPRNYLNLFYTGTDTLKNFLAIQRFYNVIFCAQH